MDQETPRLCPGPNPDPGHPREQAPPGACDCHFHIFGPYERYPLATQRGYTPPEASIASYRRVVQALRLERSVIVQPSVYQTDHACMLDAISALGGPEACRAVAVVDTSFDTAALRTLHAAGVRGARFNGIDGGGPVDSQLEQIARLIAPLDWHLQLYLPRETLAAFSPMLAQLPVSVVLDHLGRLDPAGMADPVFTAMLRLLETGRCWVKLSGYISSNLPAPYADVAPFVGALAANRPDRLIWGTNWPHPVRYRDMPADADLLDALAAWIPDATVREAVLCDNPASLYGFGPA